MKICIQWYSIVPSNVYAHSSINIINENICLHIQCVRVWTLPIEKKSANSMAKLASLVRSASWWLEDELKSTIAHTISMVTIIFIVSLLYLFHYHKPISINST